MVRKSNTAGVSSGAQDAKRQAELEAQQRREELERKRPPRFRRENTGTVLSIDHSSIHDMMFFQRCSTEFVSELTIYMDTILLKEDVPVFTEGEPKVDVYVCSNSELERTFSNF